MPRLYALAALALLAAAVIVPSVTANQAQCGPRADLVGYLDGKYQEQPVARGMTHNGGLIEVLATADGTTWSQIVTSRNNWACLVAAGEHWQALKAAFGTES